MGIRKVDTEVPNTLNNTRGREWWKSNIQGDNYRELYKIEERYKTLS